MPSAMAVGRLMTNSNLLDCTTGRSALAIENAAGVDADLTEGIVDVSSVAHQAARLGIVARRK